MSLVWREQLSVGNDVIDTDHKYLIEIVNRIERSLEAKNRNELSEAFDALAKYSQEHFAREEKIAHAVGYTQTHRLSVSHEALYKQLDNAKKEIGEMAQEWSAAVAEHFSGFLRGWLIGHVIKEDLLLKPALQKYPPNFDPK